MWAYIKDNKIQELIRFPKAMVIDGVKHPRQIFTSWTAAEKKALGILPVTPGTKLDDRFYISNNETYAIASDGNSVVGTITKAKNKTLTDTNEVNEDGSKLLDKKGNQVVTPGLRTIAKQKADTTAHSMLSRFSWLVERKITADVAIPSEVTTFMASVRTAHKSICDAIDACNSMTKFVAIHTDEYNYDSDGEITSVKTIAKVNDWPDDYDIKSYYR
ncbi:N-acetylmuramidase/lysin [uncultured Mediterranean phage uvMED]|nr:N-acetylmuramidase/lysin [uncultured Mediterranean phage uvMED]